MSQSFTREVTWGPAIYAEIRTYKGGLKRIVQIALDEVGPTVGVRATFAKLFDLDAPPSAPADRLRAWIVITALGEDPEDWGLSTDDIPKSINVNHLREVLIRQSPYIGRVAA